jgi:hypothetical protein
LHVGTQFEFVHLSEISSGRSSAHTYTLEKQLQWCNSSLCEVQGVRSGTFLHSLHIAPGRIALHLLHRVPTKGRLAPFWCCKRRLLRKRGCAFGFRTRSVTVAMVNILYGQGH